MGLRPPSASSLASDPLAGLPDALLLRDRLLLLLLLALRERERERERLRLSLLLDLDLSRQMDLVASRKGFQSS